MPCRSSSGGCPTRRRRQPPDDDQRQEDHAQVEELRQAGRLVDGSGARRWIRRLLAADLAVLAAGFVLSYAVDSELWGGVAGVAFIAMLVLGVVLGAMLLRRPDVRVPAALLVAVVPVIGLTFALEALAPGWGHPGYAETALYLGPALLGTRLAGERTADRPMARTAS